MKEKERLLREERQKELEMLVVRKQADLQFAQNEEEKRSRKLEEMKNLKGFHSKQIVSKWCTNVL